MDGNLRMGLFIWALIHQDGGMEGKRGGRQCFGHVNLSVWSFSHMIEIKSPETARSCVSTRLLPPFSHMFVLLMMRKRRRRRRRGREKECRKRDTCRSVPVRILDTWGIKGRWKPHACSLGGGSAGWRTGYCRVMQQSGTNASSLDKIENWLLNFIYFFVCLFFCLFVFFGSYLIKNFADT